MRTYIIKRLIICAFILVFVMFMTYLLMRSLPSSYVDNMALQHVSGHEDGKTVEDWTAQLNAVYGLDKGIFEGFYIWFSRVFTKFDFGDSWVYAKPVTAVFQDVIWYSFFLNIVTLALEMGISIPLGILAARKQYSKTDYAISVFALIGISLPGFFFASMLQLLFANKLHWLDFSGMVDKYHPQMTTIQQLLDYGKHYIMPITVLTVTSIGGNMRYIRTNMLEVLNADYIRTARAKGLSEDRVINYHAFRNTLIPIVTMVGGMIPGLFGGAMITETIFQLKGIGYYSLQAMQKGDIPFSMFYMSFGAVLALLGTLISDLLYAVVDPRVRVA